jgi:ATP-dependent protease HslVU (ClpYQ) peptidase subunit
MKKKKIIVLVVLVLIAGAAFIGYKLFDKNVKRLAGSKADLSISATDLVKKFETDEAAANKEFLGKKTDFIITVSGLVKEVIKDETNAYTVVLGDSTTASSVRCSMDSLQNQQTASLKKGDSISIKGAITGFMKDDLGIGSDVVLNRCVLEVKK